MGKRPHKAKPGASPRFHWTRRRIRIAGIVGVVLVGAALLVWQFLPTGKIDPTDSAQVAQGQAIYMRECAVCHGDKMQGQPEWKTPKSNGAFPAPPHDTSGHTWHHGDDVLFAIVKNGVAAFAPPGYVSEMPVYAGKLSDAGIRAALAYIESTWPDSIRQARAAHVAAGH